MSPPIRKFYVEGPIGVGKSSLLAHLEEIPELTVLYEPLESWTRLEGEFNVLKNFYDAKTDEDKSSALLRLQSVILGSMHSREREAEGWLKHSDKTVVLERSQQSARVFIGEALAPYLSSLDRAVIQNLISHLRNCYPRDCLVFSLTAETPVLLERIKRRARPEEAGMSDKYVDEVRAAFDDWSLQQNHVRIDTSKMSIEEAAGLIFRKIQSPDRSCISM